MVQVLIIDVITITGNGELDFEEFKAMMAKQLNTFDSYQAIFKGKLIRHAIYRA